MDLHLTDNYATHMESGRGVAKSVTLAPLSISIVFTHQRLLAAIWWSCWFGLLTEQLRRGVHQSSAELEADIYRYRRSPTKTPSPVWTKTADEILGPCQRYFEYRTLDGWECRVGHTYDRKVRR